MSGVMALGLGWRSGYLPLSGFLTKYGGDALWAWMVFLALTVAFPRHGSGSLALSALGIAWAVEFLQLHHGAWIDAVRSTQLGRMALGTTFNPPDLIAYAVGIALGAWVDLRCVDRDGQASADGS